MDELDSTPRIPDNLGIAAAALAASVATILLSATVLTATGGRFWISFGASLCGAVAVYRALRARFARAGMGNDTRHELGEGARSLAVVSLLYSGGVIVLNGVMLAFAASGP
jgi:hypothetical protein